MGCGQSTPKLETMDSMRVRDPMHKHEDEGPKHFVSKEDLDELFRLWDFDGSGNLELKEIASIVGKLDAERVVATVDHNHDKKMDRQEFEEYLHNTCPFMFTDPSTSVYQNLKGMILERRYEVENIQKNIEKAAHGAGLQ